MNALWCTNKGEFSSFSLSLILNENQYIHIFIYLIKRNKIDISKKPFIFRYQIMRMKRFITLLCIMTEKEKHRIFTRKQIIKETILFKCQERDFFMSYKDKWFIILSSCPLVFYIYFTTRESSEGVTAQVRGSLAPRSNNLLKYYESAILINLNPIKMRVVTLVVKHLLLRQNNHVKDYV